VKRPRKASPPACQGVGRSQLDGRDTECSLASIVRIVNVTQHPTTAIERHGPVPGNQRGEGVVVTITGESTKQLGVGISFWRDRQAAQAVQEVEKGSGHWTVSPVVVEPHVEYWWATGTTAREFAADNLGNERTMRKRLLIAAGLSAVLAVSALVVVWFGSPRDRISEANYARIREGMTLHEVETVLGGPEGSYTSEGNDWAMEMALLKAPVGHTRRTWMGDDGGIRIEFDEQERVVTQEWCPRRESFFARVRGWMRL
jgi:hypothetical protein